MSALFTALVESETKESLADMVINLRKEVAELRANLDNAHKVFGAGCDETAAIVARLQSELNRLTEEKRTLLREVAELRAARAPEGLSEMLGHILDEHEDEIIDWCHEQSRRGRPDTDDVIRRILALLQATGPVMPEMPSDEVVELASAAIGIGANGWEVYRLFRTALITEQKESNQ